VKKKKRKPSIHQIGEKKKRPTEEKNSAPQAVTGGWATLELRKQINVDEHQGGPRPKEEGGGGGNFRRSSLRQRPITSAEEGLP